MGFTTRLISALSDDMFSAKQSSHPASQAGKMRAQRKRRLHDASQSSVENVQLLPLQLAHVAVNGDPKKMASTFITMFIILFTWKAKWRRSCNSPLASRNERFAPKLNFCSCRRRWI